MRACLLNSEVITMHQSTLTPPGRLLGAAAGGFKAAADRAMNAANGREAARGHAPTGLTDLEAAPAAAPPEQPVEAAAPPEQPVEPAAPLEQPPEGACPFPHRCAVWARRLTPDGSTWLVALVNRAPEHSQLMTLEFSRLGWAANATARVRDVLYARDWPATSVGQAAASVRPHATALLKLTRSS